MVLAREPICWYERVPGTQGCHGTDQQLGPERGQQQDRPASKKSGGNKNEIVYYVRILEERLVKQVHRSARFRASRMRRREQKAMR